jgi:hypothetical protein
METGEQLRASGQASRKLINMQTYYKTALKYTLRFWLFQLAINIGVLIYICVTIKSMAPIQTTWLSLFVSIPQWLLCLTAGCLSAFGGRVWLLIVVLQIFGNLAMIQYA